LALVQAVNRRQVVLVVKVAAVAHTQAAQQ
jgi:hypothetical protein